MSEEERVRGEIAWRLAEWYCTPIDNKNSHDEGWEAFLEEVHIECIKHAKELLSIKGIRIESENQGLPKPEIDIHLWQEYSPAMAYEKAQEDMLKAGFVKVVQK